MSLTMHIYSKKDDTSQGWDVSEIVHDIEYTTSILGQPGKLTFVLEKDMYDSGLQISVGSLVKFWHSDDDLEEEKPVFMGNVFTIGTDRSDAYRVVAYDSLRYLQNHDDMCIEDKTVEDVFKVICKSCGIPDNKCKIVGNIDKSIKIKSKVFIDSSYFDILQYAIDWTNSYALTSEVEKLQDIKVGDEVYYSGGESWKSSDEDTPATTNRTAGNAKVTLIKENAKHKYHIQGIDSNVYGWVNESSVTSEKQLNQLMDNFYYIRDNFGTIELRETKYCGTYDENGNRIKNWLIIGDGSLLTNYQYEVDIDKNTFNEFYFKYNNKNKNSNSDSETNQQVQDKILIGAIQAGTKISETNTKLDETIIGEDTIPKWGKLRKYVTVNDISDKDLLAEYMKINVEHFNQPTRSLKLSALGYDGVYAGDTFYLLLGKLKLSNAVYVLNATHHYNGDSHTMDLEVNTSPAMEVFC